MTINSDRNLVEDSIQDLFTKYCGDASLILTAQNQKAYLKSSLRNLVIKKSRDRKLILDNDLKIREIAVPSYEELLVNRQIDLQRGSNMRQALTTLSKIQKTIITMRFYRSMSYEKIAEKLDISVRTVNNQIYSSIKKIRTFYINL